MGLKNMFSRSNSKGNNVTTKQTDSAKPILHASNQSTTSKNEKKGKTSDEDSSPVVFREYTEPKIFDKKPTPVEKKFHIHETAMAVGDYISTGVENTLESVGTCCSPPPTQKTSA
mmetsp:Transcript_16903/g.24786  ORF Transcript_16903/g.24786 Transcript_16903/m.24786 type:complete len:115 (-) Transcript_16903:314-658(-)